MQRPIAELHSQKRTRLFNINMRSSSDFFFLPLAYSNYELHVPQASNSLQNQQLLKPEEGMFCKGFLPKCSI